MKTKTEIKKSEKSFNMAEAYDNYVCEKLDQLSFITVVAMVIFDIYEDIARDPETLDKLWRRLCLALNHPPTFDESNIEIFFEKLNKLVTEAQKTHGKNIC